MKTKGIIALFAVVFVSISCSDDEKQPRELTLASNSTDLIEDIYPVTVLITSGSRDYEIGQGDISIAFAEIVLGESYGKYGAVKLTGKKIGTTTITITDKVLDQQQDLEVRVNEGGVRLTMIDTQVTSNTGDDKELEKKIEAIVAADLPFDIDYMYLLSNEEKGVMYADAGTGNKSARYFRHVQEDDGKIFLEINPDSDWDDDPSVRRLEFIAGASVMNSLYEKFFGLDTAVSRAEQIVEPKIYYREDLTEKIREQFPEKEVDSVTAVYVMLIEFVVFK